MWGTHSEAWKEWGRYPFASDVTPQQYGILRATTCPRTEAADVSDAGRDLLDGALWAVESVALLPETDLDALSVVTFMLSPDLQGQADALGARSEQMAAFLAEAVDLEVEIRSAWVFDPEAWHGAVKEIGLAYS